MQMLKAPHLDKQIGRLLLGMCAIFASTVMAHTPFQCTHLGDLVACPSGIPDHDMSDFISSPFIFWESGGQSDESPAPVLWMDESPSPVSPSPSPVSSSDTSVSPSPSVFDGFTTGEQQLANTFSPCDGGDCDDDSDSRNIVDIMDAGDRFFVAFFGAFGDMKAATSVLSNAAVRSRSSSDDDSPRDDDDPHYELLQSECEEGCEDGEHEEYPGANMTDSYYISVYGEEEFVRTHGRQPYNPVEQSGSTCDLGGCSLGTLDDIFDPACDVSGSICDAGALDVVFETTCDPGGGCAVSGVTFDDVRWDASQNFEEAPFGDYVFDPGYTLVETERESGRFLGVQIPDSYTAGPHDIDDAFSELEGCVFINCSDDTSSSLKVPGFPSVPKNQKSQALKTEMKELNQQILKDGNGKTLHQQIAETDYNIATIRVRQDTIDELIKDSEDGTEYLQQLKDDSEKTSVNPYSSERIDKKAALKTGSFAATRLLVKNPTPAGIIAGFVLDGVEAGVRTKIKSDTEDALEDYVKSSRENVIGLYEVHSALSADLNVELARKAELKELKTETDDLWNSWAEAATAEQKQATAASKSAVLKRETDAAGDREEAKKPGGGGVTGSRGATPYKASGGVTRSR